MRDDGLAVVDAVLVARVRIAEGRKPAPTAGIIDGQIIDGQIIDGQSVKTGEAGGPRGYDAGKTTNAPWRGSTGVGVSPRTGGGSIASSETWMVVALP